MKSLTNYYKCTCGCQWDSIWDSSCDDECNCGNTISPYATKENNEYDSNLTIITDYSMESKLNDKIFDLTKQQYKDLHKVISLSKGYRFVVHKNNFNKHIKISVWKDEDEVGSVINKEHWQWENNDPENEKVVKRICHRVFKMTTKEN